MIQARHLASILVERGSTNVVYQADGSTGGFANVTFSHTFSVVPMVIAQDRLANGRTSSVTVSEVTKTGFRLLARNSSGSSAGDAEVSWIAIGV